MIKVIVVDDEKVIRDGIGRFIKEMKGFEFLSACADGEDAFEKIMEQKPDLVICDIIMPRCDGIELLKRCREHEISSEFILLSGYSEFEYARAAIKYEVLAYLNKPINRQELIKELECAKETIIKKQNIRKELKSNTYEKILETSDVSLQLQENQIVHRVMVLNTDTGVADKFRMKNLDLTIKYAEAFLREYAEEEYIVYQKNGMAVIILLGEDTRQTFIEEICKKILRYACGKGYSVVCGIGDIVHQMQDIPFSYKKAKAAMYEAGILKVDICYFERLPYTYKMPSGIYMPEIHDAWNAIHRYDQEALLEIVNTAIVRYKKLFPPYFMYYIVKKCTQELLDCISGYLEEDSIHMWKKRQTELETAPNVSELCYRFENLTRALFEECSKKREEKNYAGNMDEILQYIQLNYAGDLSIEKICSVFFFNQSYFSALFKSKTGQKYSDYVMELRIEKAKELLSIGKYKVYEVAEMVGYNSSRYFSKVFKIKTGVLPQHYKK